jgi:hypothetical protein
MIKLGCKRDQKMLPIELRASTGHSQVDNILRGLIGIYQTVFPGGLRCVYVVGSHSDGSAVPASDLDIGVVFYEPLTDEHRTQFRQINQSLALISPVRLDCGTVNPERFTHGIPAGLKTALVVYGEHIFNELPLEPMEQALRRTMSSTFHSLYVLRQRDETLVYPLKYPDPAGDYFGYERWGTYLGGREFGPGVRSLVTSATLIASCLVMLRTGQRIASKKESVLAYQTHIGDEWSELVQEIYGQCKVAWGYQLPENMEARHKLHDLCAKMLEFENHFLSHCREQILSDLLHPEKTIQEMALYRLKRIAYSGKDYEAALIALQAHEDIEIAQRAEAVLAKLTSG